MTSLIINLVACEGREGGMTSWVRSPLSSLLLIRQLEKLQYLIVSLSTAPDLLFLVNFHAMKAEPVIRCIFFHSYAAFKGICPVSSLPWQYQPWSLCHAHGTSATSCPPLPTAVIFCLGGVRAAADICRYLDSISPPTSAHPPPFASWCQPLQLMCLAGRVGWCQIGRSTTYYSVTRQLLHEGPPHTSLLPLPHLFISSFSHVSHLSRQLP